MAPLAGEGIGAVGDRVGVVQVEQPAELGERVVAVFDSQLDGRLPRLAPGGNHQQRRRLAAANVATGCLRCLERGEQPPRQRAGAVPNAAAIAGHTAGEAIRFAWALNPSPASCPA